MNEEPPKCFLGCFDVRTGALVASIVNIVRHAKSLAGDIGFIIQSPGIAMIQMIIDIFFLYVNIKLRKGVFERDTAPIRLWLWTYFVRYILSAFAVIVSIMVISFADLKTTESEILKEPGCIISEGLCALWYYPVYQLYMFEKTNKLQRTGLPRDQMNICV